jgi:hypothetical protein
VTRWAVHVARTGDIIAYNVLVEKPEGKISFKNLRHR